MQDVLEANNNQFSHYWSLLFANDPLQHPLYAQQVKNPEAAGNFSDRSFLVLTDGEPVFGCSLTTHRDGLGRTHLGYFGMDAATHINRRSMMAGHNNFRPEAIETLRQHMDTLLQEIRPDSINFLDPVSCGIMSPISQLLLENGAFPQVYQAQVLDLTQSVRSLQHNLRTSYRSLVSWGLANIDIELIDPRCQRGAGNETLQSLFAADELANDNTTFDRLRACESVLSRERTLLVRASQQRTPLGQALFALTDNICYLIASNTCSDASDRSPLHSMVWRALIYSKRLGCEQFDLGYPVAQSIAKDFGAGFGGASHTRMKIKLGN